MDRESDVSKQETGRTGETIARAYVQKLGWRILHQNWRCQYGELDLVALDGAELVIIEVRTRRGSAALRQALESVDWRKQRQLLRVSQAYVSDNGFRETQPMRIDVIGVGLRCDNSGSVEHIRDAYQW